MLNKRIKKVFSSQKGTQTKNGYTLKQYLSSREVRVKGGKNPIFTSLDASALML